ncbi:PASTA domain-containing protein [Krasilnikovia sp. M28-CT-15]|uniref:PASTA domain-containing protein n=1 Tax=Krasilnikovia sp. M28-CT-15 TaxID=3373540 RepID=UPI003875C56B
MSDEQGRRREPDGEASEPDETRPSGPVPATGNQPDDGPRSGDAAGPEHTDRTAAEQAGPEPTASTTGPVGGDESSAPGPPAGGDATAVMPTPVGADPTTVLPGAPADDATAIVPPPATDDATTVLDSAAGDATAVLRPAGDDATAVVPGARGDDATAVLPGAVGSEPGWGAAWAGRAEVRPPRPSAAMGDTREEWAVPADREPRGRWWLPVLVGLVVVALLALLGWGVFQILRALNHDEEAPAPVVTSSAGAPPSTAPSSEPSPPSSPPSTAATTSLPPTTEPTGPTEVTVPALKGLSVQDARQALERTGLAYRVRFVRSEAPPGTVIDSDPAEGQQVPPDTTVTLIVSAPPSPSAEPSSTPTGTSGQPDQD